MFSFRQILRVLKASYPKGRTKPNPKSGSKRRRFELEALENRLVPSITTAFNAGLLTISLSAPGDHAFVQVEGDGGIDVGTGEAGPPPVLIILPPITFRPLSPIQPLASNTTSTFEDNDILADQLGVTAIVVQDTSSGASALGQDVTFYGIKGFSQNISTANIETVDVNQLISGTISGNASTVNVTIPGTIQSGVDFAAAGATVNVAGGTYTELVTVNRTLTLKGNNAGVDARTRLAPENVTPETVVNGPGGSFALNADNIVLDGFTVKDATTGAPGITTSPLFSGYRIRDNIIESNAVGLTLGSSGTNQTIVEQNWIKGNGLGVNDEGPSNLLFEHNLLSGPQTAISFAGPHGPGVLIPLTNLTISDNVFQDGNNLQLSDVNNSTISGNQFSGSLPGVFPLLAPGVLTPVPTAPAVILGSGDDHVTVTGNTFTDRGGPAIQVANLGLGFGPNSDISITDNTINQNVTLAAGGSNASVALIDLNGVEGTTTVNANLVSLSNHLLVPTTIYAVEIEGGTTATVNVTNNQLDGNDVDALSGTSAGIYLLNTLPTSAVINIRNNYLNGFVNGVYADGVTVGDLYVIGTQVHVNFNDLTRNSKAVVVNSPIHLPVLFQPIIVVGEPPPVFPPLPGVLDLQDNWWGVLSAQAISAQISGNATPDAWLTSGLDAEPNLTGFQPDLNNLLSTNTNLNTAPTLMPVPAQSRFHNQGPFTITVSANDPVLGDTVTLGAFLPSEVAFELHQQLQLTLDGGGVYSNFFGQGEDWLRGATNQFGNSWYYILPDGQLYAWDGSARTSGARLATLTSTYAMNPSLLYAPPSPPPVQVSVSGNQLTIDPGTYVGSFEVIVEATDGRKTTTSSFTVTVTNRVPVITTTADQTMAAGQNQITVPIATTDADNDPLTYSAIAGNLAYVLQQTYNLSFAGSLYVNYGGAQEKWLKGNTNQNGNSWYFIEPSGLLYAWDGTANSAAGTLLGTLDPIFYMRPDLIYNAQAQDLAYVLNQTLNLTSNGNYYQNYAGVGEKWLEGNVNQFGNSWYFIMPSGDLCAWDGTSNEASGPVLARLDSIAYNQPQRLYAAQANPFSISMTGNVLTINRAPGYLGSFDILVRVGDGLAKTTERFHVTAS